MSARLSTDAWLDLWSRGGIGISRLPDFVAGMCLAHAWHADSAGLDARLRRPGLRLGALALYVSGFLASATLVGMTVAPLLMVVGLFPFLYVLVAPRGSRRSVQSNALGFPAPTPVEARTPGTLRVMTFGDAFISAEGVDTPQAWPRLLEARLRAGGAAEVQNFAVTGYGPTQYAALARAFLPRFRPDVLVMTFFVNDFADTRTSHDTFLEETGFGLGHFDKLPPAVDLKDPKYDVERPQRLALPLIAEAGFEALDLRPVLKALPACPYQPENMHWLPEGHAAVAEAVARALGR